MILFLILFTQLFSGQNLACYHDHEENMTKCYNFVKRDPAVARAFRKANACPATGKFDGPCPGYVIDHIYSLCLGGPDIVENMAWEEIKESYVKDAFERRMCAMKTKLGL